MSQFSVLYRAFTEYRKHTLENGECLNERKILKNSNIESEKLQGTRYVYTIQDDWIKAIEDGIVYLDKCIREERQFIRTQGEVVPIEKAKKVSKSSITHLAKHSNLITHVQEDNQILPDNIYMVEKLSDYAVYENKFIYMVLCYLRDFIDLRLKKIMEIASTYDGVLELDKSIKNKIRDLNVKISLKERRMDNPFPLDNPSQENNFKRINEIASAINSLLETPLMQEVGKTPMIKPPIVKTNVIRMNTNFKNALELYEYISTYSGNGYTVEEVTKKLEPFSDELGDELAELFSLSSFLTFEYGNNLHDILKKEYEDEEERKLEEEGRKLAEQIKILRRQASEEGFSVEEYMILLDRRNRVLENEHILLEDAKNLLDKLSVAYKELEEKEVQLKEQIASLEDNIKEKEAEIEIQRVKHIEELAVKDDENRKAIEALNEKFKAEIYEIGVKHKEELLQYTNNSEQTINKLNEDNDNKIKGIVDTYEKRIDEKLNEYQDNLKSLNENLHNEITGLKDNYEAKIAALKAENEKTKEELKATKIKMNNEAKAAKKEIDKTIEEKYLAIGQLHGLRQMHNLITDEEDFTSRERFEELEQEYAAFKNLFKTKWKDTKKRIRKELFAEKPVSKPRKNKKEEVVNIENKDKLDN